MIADEPMNKRSFHEQEWDAIYERLVAYKKQNNSTCVPRLYKADRQLAIWVGNQRIYFNTNKSYLTKERNDRLNAIAFVWDPRAARWKTMYERRVTYKKQNTSTCVPKSYKADPQLARWVTNQRLNHRTNRPSLTTARVKQLNSIGFIWNPKNI